MGDTNNKNGIKRGSYKCQRCNVPKKGHVCPYQRVYKKQGDPSPSANNCIGIQVELGGTEMTVRVLDLGAQGLAESYIDMSIAQIAQSPVSSKTMHTSIVST